MKDPPVSAPEWPVPMPAGETETDSSLLLPDRGLRIDLGGAAAPPRTEHGHPAQDSPTARYAQNLFSPKTLAAVALILAWYSVSSALNVFNKWFFGRANYAYPYPIFITGCHMLIQSFISFLVLLFVYPSWRPSKVVSGWDYATKIVPCAFAAGLDIALTNSSLQYITLSFTTMIKSSVPIFVLIFAAMFGLEKPKPALVLVVLVICAGTALMVVGELRFDWTGFIQSSIATVMSGLRWTLTHLLLAKDEMGIANPIATNLYVAPAMASCMFAVGLALEGLPRMSGKGPELFLYVVSSGGLAWFLVMFEFGEFRPRLPAVLFR